MNNDSAYQRFVALVNKYTSFSICLPSNPTGDSVASAMALYLSLIKAGKNATIACSADVTPNLGISGVDKIQKNLASGGDNLVVSFPYSDGSIDKVTYNIEGNSFNLVIQPREGYDKLDPQRVRYTYSGGKVDVIIVVDAPTLNSLGELYSGNQDQFKGRDIVNIDRHLTNANFGTVNIVEKKISSTAEIVLRLLGYLNAQVDRDIATNLYSGIMSATNNFTSYSVTSETFEASAYLLKAGAVKKTGLRQPLPQAQQTIPRPSMNQPMNQPMPSFQPQPAARQPMPSFQSLPATAPGADSSLPNSTEEYLEEEESFSFPPIADNQPAVQPIPNTRPVNEAPAIKEKKVENKEIKSAEGLAEEDKKTAPKEWLKPKIFRGSNLV